MKKIFYCTIMALCCITTVKGASTINRQEILKRNNPTIKHPDSLSSLTVGNGNIAMTVDITGMQSYPEYYKNGIPLTTMSAWGWHSVPNRQGLKSTDTEKSIDTHNGHGAGIYAVECKNRPNGMSDSPKQIAATNYFRQNPHRLNLGIICLELFDEKENYINDITKLHNIRQTLDLYTGTINSQFSIDAAGHDKYYVTTVCSQDKDRFLFKIEGEGFKRRYSQITLRFPYPTFAHSDDGADWETDTLHDTYISKYDKNSIIIQNTIDSTQYLVKLSWEGKAMAKQVGMHEILLVPDRNNREYLNIALEYIGVKPLVNGYTRNTDGNANDNNAGMSITQLIDDAQTAMKNYWQRGGFADFSLCTDKRAKEIERRMVLSQYLMKVNEDCNQPPQEAGLTYNTWYGRPHMEMIWWHSLQWSLWNRPEILEKQMTWYNNVEKICRNIAERQNYKGVRWLKMTDPWGGESPSNVGSFLIWQQPHYIYLAEEMYRRQPSLETINKYYDLVMATAEFMADFVTFDSADKKYHLRGCTGMQESLRWNEIFDPAFEIEYWKYGLAMAQKWRERKGEKRISKWDDIVKDMTALPQNNGLYEAAKTLPDTDNKDFYINTHRDHPSVLGALSLIPSNITTDIDTTVMNSTYDKTMTDWDWATTWGWDYGMTAMAAVRLNRPEYAINALLMDTQKNTYLKNGHNYQDGRLRVYLPGNGALLTTLAMMMAGWDGCPDKTNPGFPANGQWNVKWEGINKMQ